MVRNCAPENLDIVVEIAKQFRDSGLGPAGAAPE
jgi:hypothetical protein